MSTEKVFKTQSKKCNLMIDPGLSGTGYAIFNYDYSELYAWGNITPKDEFIICKSYSIVRTLVSKCSLYHIGRVVIEYPKVMGSSLNLAIAKKGDIVKLAFFVGYVSAKASENLNNPFIELLDVNKWKGQLKKKPVQNRVLRHFPTLKIRSHAVDAVGMGLYKRGDL